MSAVARTPLSPDAIEEAADERFAREAELHRNDPTVGTAELVAGLFALVGNRRYVLYRRL